MIVKRTEMNVIPAASVAGNSAVGALVLLVMIKESILDLSMAFEWALDDAERA